jgi:hypothetical protein
MHPTAIAACGISGLVLAIAGQLCLILLILRGSPLLALVALLVPCFAWYFALDNWDVARWPAVCHFGGILIYFTAAAVGSPFY